MSDDDIRERDTIDPGPLDTDAIAVRMPPHDPVPRTSDPHLLANAPPWVAEILRHFDESKIAEQEAREQAHRASSRISAAFLKLEANSELVRQEVLGLRADMRDLERKLGQLEYRIDQKLQHLERHFELRFAAMETRIIALETERNTP